MDAVRDHAKGWAAIRRRTVESMPALAAAVVAALLIRAFLVQAFYIPSGSMEPTLEPGDYILVNRFIYTLHPPRRGDIVVFRYPRDEHWDFVKRVIGLPGDVVEERDGQFWVNGEPLREAYVQPAAQGMARPAKLDPLRVPPRQLFVLGDNREASLDSRYWGTVSQEKVIGEAFLIYWSRGKHWWKVRWERIGQLLL